MIIDNRTRRSYAKQLEENIEQLQEELERMRIKCGRFLLSVAVLGIIIGYTLGVSWKL
jgi:hypothetical protein